MLEQIALLNGLTQKMNFLQTRQRILSQNISNADNPGYAAMDLKKPDFAKTLGMSAVTGVGSGQAISMTTTSPLHSSHIQLLGRAEAGERIRQPYEITKTKNSVNLEEQVMSASQTASDYQLVTNIYNKNIDMMNAAIKG